MALGNLATPQGLKSLNDAVRERSYLQGYQPSQADTTAFEAIKSAPGLDLPHALRWYHHIKSFGDLRKQFPGASSPAAAAKSSPPADDDDDVDLFGSDDDDAEAEKIKEQRLKEYAEKKSKKPGPIAKSSVVLDVKPWDDETDMKEMEKNVRTIVKDGLVWGASKLVPVGYGINKLQIMCVVEDDKISIEELTEDIQGFEDFVQSVDVAAFNKI